MGRARQGAGSGRRFVWPWQAWAGVAAAACIAVVFAVPPLRAAALGFMQLFRVEQVKVAQINPRQIEGQAETSQALARVLSDQVTAQPLGEEREVASTSEASEAAGFEVRLPDMPDAPASIVVQPGVDVNLAIDVERINGVLDELGHPEIDIPAALDGSSMSLAVRPGVRVEYPGEDGTEGATFIQMPSPTVSAPAAFPIARIGEAFLQVLGMSREEARRFSESVDWATTLVVPVPQGEGNEYREVPVDGVTGTLVHHRENDEDAYLLIWVKDGMISALAGRTEPVDVRISAAPRIAERPIRETLRLTASPNPSRDVTEISWAVPAGAQGKKGAAKADAGPVAGTLDIYDVSGRRVARFDLGADAREGVVRWDGRDASGSPAAPGMYYARLVSGKTVATTRISRVR